MSKLCYDQSCLKLVSQSLYPDIHLTTFDGRGRLLPAHRVILVTASNKFEEILGNVIDYDPLIVRNIRFDILEKIINLVYRGNVDIKDTIEEEDMWDGLHMLRIRDHNMGIIYGISNSSCSAANGEISVGRQMEDRTQNISLIKEEKMLGEDSVIRHDTDNKDEGMVLKHPVVNIKKRKTPTARDKYLKFSGNCKASVKPRTLVKCDLCCKCFGNGNLSRHQRQVHSKTKLKKPFNCDLCCNLGYNSRGTLSRHQRQVHGKTKKFVRDNNVQSKTFTCDICQTAYKFSRNLRKHNHKEHGKIKPTNNNSRKCQYKKCMIKTVKDGGNIDVTENHVGYFTEDVEDETNGKIISSRYIKVNTLNDHPGDLDEKDEIDSDDSRVFCQEIIQE